MPERYVVAFILFILAMLGWNVFLMHRDAQLFRANPTPSAEVRK